MKENENNRIIQGIIKGDDKIIKDFYCKHLPQVTNYILNNSGDESDAKDIFQDALVIFFEKRREPNFELKCSLGTYVYGVSRNLWFNRLRKQDKMIHKEDLSFSPSVTEDDIIINDLDLKEKRSLIQKHFMKLGNGCQEILLWFFKGYSIREIAQKKEMTEGYARKRKFICQKKLMEMIGKDPMYTELKNTSKN